MRLTDLCAAEQPNEERPVMNVFQLNTTRSAVFLRAPDIADGKSDTKLAMA